MTRLWGVLIWCIVGSVIALSGVAAPALADTTVAVTNTADEKTAGDGCSVREAVDFADGSTTDAGISDCAPGTASGTTTIDIRAGHYVLTAGSGPLTLSADMVLSGAGAGATSIDGANATEVIDVSGSTVHASIANLTITGGNSGTLPFFTGDGFAGGGIYNAGILTLNGVTVSGNRTGGGVVPINFPTLCGTFPFPPCPPPPVNAGSGGAGGGIFNSGTLTVTGSTISGNTTGNGGSGVNGADSSSGTASAGGSSGSGGAGAGIDNTGTLTITNSTITGNTAGAGGDASSGGNGTASGVAGGDAGTAGNGGAGGGIESTGTLTITGTTISANRAGAGGKGGTGGTGNGSASGGKGSSGGNAGTGGGIDSAATMTLSNSTLTGNSTAAGGQAGSGGAGTPGGASGIAGIAGAGGGVNQSAAGATLLDLTVYGNTAAGKGGGLSNAGGGSTIDEANTIVASNHGASDLNCTGTITDQHNNIVFGDNSCAGSVNGDPKLGPLASNGGPTQTMALQHGSAAVDHVPLMQCPQNVDQRGVSRPQGAACDAGAYELAPPSISGSSGTANTSTTATVSASVNPNLKDTKVTVNYGTASSYGSSTTTQDIGAGNGAVSFSAALSGLTPSTTYHFQIVAVNGDGTTTTSDGTFSTPAPPPPLAATLRSASTAGATATLSIACDGGHPGDTCSGPVTMRSRVTTQAGRVVGVAARRRPKPRVTKIVTVATGSYSVATGQTHAVKVTLNAAGRRLLSARYAFTATVTIGGTTPINTRIAFRYAVIRSPISFTWAFTRSSTTAQLLSVGSVPSGGHVAVICHGGGCPFAHRTFRPRRGSVSLTGAFSSARLRPGAALTIEITAPNSVGKVLTFTIRSGAAPSQSKRCLPPGARAPSACA